MEPPLPSSMCHRLSLQNRQTLETRQFMSRALRGFLISKINGCKSAAVSTIMSFDCSPYSTCTVSLPTQPLVSMSKQKWSAQPIIVKYLIDNFGFTKTRATSIASRHTQTHFPGKHESLLCFLRNIGFSEAQIKASVYVTPQLLVCNFEKTIKPKLEFFQKIGLTGSDLGNFISKNSSLLSLSLNKKLTPSVEVLKRILSCKEGNKDLLLVLKRCSWVISRYPDSRLLASIDYFESCGIVGSQLSMLLKRQPRLFVMRATWLRQIVSRVVDMGVPVDSRMLVHALITICGQTDVTLKKKIKLLNSFGFSENDCMEMFRKAPVLFRMSEDKLRTGVEFFLDTMKYEKSFLVHRPCYLMYSMEGRIFPRYNVLQLLKEKKLLKKAPSFMNILNLTEEDFLKKFITRFNSDVEESLHAYKGHMLDSEEDR